MSASGIGLPAACRRSISLQSWIYASPSAAVNAAATVALIIAPWVLGYDNHHLATWFCVAVGAGGLAATLLTRFESDLEPAMGRAGMQPAH